MIAALTTRPSPIRRGAPDRIVALAWALAGVVIWLIALNTCFVCEAEPEAIYVGYSEHQSARGTKEPGADLFRRPERLHDHEKQTRAFISVIRTEVAEILEAAGRGQEST